ncbi:MAG: carboxypeptidase-like regulatory domain-containing protein [Bacteroidetes bacterium]|nr:carboxypeptidase-like regulatory domain-containing protein [Bacteroidota bacterium]
MIALSLACHRASAQVEVSGTVYDRSQLFFMPHVSVLTSSGKTGTATDSVGHYTIHVKTGDSVYFSYLGKETQRFPIKVDQPTYPLNISLAVTIDSLPLVVVRPKLYRYDSLENRDEYRKVFEYQPDGPIANGGLSLDALLNGKKNRQMLALQQRLIEQEHDRYVDHRFNKILVKKITGLQGALLDTFMKMYRPTYEYIQACENDYEFYKYIKDCGRYFARQWGRGG